MRRGVAGLTAAALLVLALALPSGAGAIKTLTMGGDVSARIVMGLVAEQYLVACDGCVRFGSGARGEKAALREVARDEIHFALAAADRRPSGDGKLKFVEFARQAVCVVTHPSNPVPSLIRAQIAAIFSGQTRDWSEVPGAKATGTIDLITARNRSWSAKPLERRLGLTKLSPNAEPEGWEFGISGAVLDDPAAIAYLAPSVAEGVHLVGFGGVPCTRANVESGRYPASTSFFWATKGAPKGEAKEFLDWVRTSPEARRRIEQEAYAVR
jgi:phosphate transport system substrate-binding protein